MLTKSLADVVTEQAPKRLLLDMNQEMKAKRCVKIGTSVVKRLALVQADIRPKREEAGEIYELAPAGVEVVLSD